MIFKGYKNECTVCGYSFETEEYYDAMKEQCKGCGCIGNWVSKVIKYEKAYMRIDKLKDKTQYSLLDPKFLKAMADNMAEGIKGDRKADDWKELDWKDPEVRRQYKDALLRHVLEDENWAAVACNAMFLWSWGE